MQAKSNTTTSLIQSLAHEPQVLKFGTSGRRGDVVHLTQLEIYINATAELEYLLSLPAEQGGIRRGDEFYYAADLRPSSAAFVPEQGGRGGIAQAIEQAIRDAGLRPVNLGLIPTPALTCYAIGRQRGSMMITGSHIPFDRNGYKTNTAHGELLKKDEAPIGQRVQDVRQRIYDQPAEQSMFDAQGHFKDGHRELSAAIPDAREAYIQRYTDFFAGRSLEGMRLLAYQHSAVGRDLLVDLLQRLGAQVIPAGRSETFVPIDTEAIDADQLATIQQLAADAWQKHGALDAVVSTDGDSDRPLLLGVTAGGDAGAPCTVRFFGGDLLGMVVAEYLGADAVVVPISCNDAVDRGPLKKIVEPKTRIGSPYVIAGMEKARAKGRRVICGWEANGGFLTGSDINRDGRTLAALPTRDAMLPILGALFAARERSLTLGALFDRLPARYSKAALLRRFPRPTSLKIIERFSPGEPSVADCFFDGEDVRLQDADGRSIAAGKPLAERMRQIRSELSGFFTPDLGFGKIARLNYIDGVRIYFDNADVAHVRPSGNADELRIYAVADTQQRADAIASAGTAEPEGILRRLEQTVSTGADDQAIADFTAQPDLVPLTGVVQHYDWGGREFIPALLGMTNAAGKPFAELWMGAHPSAPSIAELGDSTLPLTRLVEANPGAVLGAAVAAQCGGKLPYLFKVLDAHKMLSIQAHPTLEQAKEGFERENRAGVPLKAANRNYRDSNHKPEVHVALTEFWMLHGFRPLEEIAATFNAVPELRPVMPDFEARLIEIRAGAERAALLRELYQQIMTLPQDRVDAILNPLIHRLQSRPVNDKGNPDFWALRAADHFPLPGAHRDRGIFSIYLLNLVHLHPGEGTYQPAGTLHAYLEGVNVELMANSDNVLRGGLTPKHVDVPELMHILSFAAGKPDVLKGRRAGDAQTIYPTPATEFELSRLDVRPGHPYRSSTDHSADILIVLEGAADVTGAKAAMKLGRGEIVLAPAGVAYSVAATDRPAVLFKASVPQM